MLEEGRILADRYEITGRIGAGGMSDVYKAKDDKLNRFVAIKVLKQEFSENRSFVAKFQVEAQSAAGLAHPNIVNVYDVGHEGDIHYIVMELVEGITLKQYIEKKLRLSVKETISIAIQVSMGIEAAHNNHIIHRDIKPQNIIISKEGKVKVTDFGIARAASSNTITSNAMGSVHYTSPEQARGGYSDEKSDIYSLGITMFEMLTGRVPFDGETTVAIAVKHIQEPFPSPRIYLEDIPISLEQIIIKCCQKSSDRRYQNMGELIVDLKRSLMTPDEDFVVIPDTASAAATKLVTDEDVKKIKQETDSIIIDPALLTPAGRPVARNTDAMGAYPETQQEQESLQVDDFVNQSGQPVQSEFYQENVDPREYAQADYLQGDYAQNGYPQDAYGQQQYAGDYAQAGYEQQDAYARQDAYGQQAGYAQDGYDEAAGYGQDYEDAPRYAGDQYQDGYGTSAGYQDAGYQETGYARDAYGDAGYGDDYGRDGYADFPADDDPEYVRPYERSRSRKTREYEDYEDRRRDYRRDSYRDSYGDGYEEDYEGEYDDPYEEDSYAERRRNTGASGGSRRKQGTARDGRSSRSQGSRSQERNASGRKKPDARPKNRKRFDDIEEEEDTLDPKMERLMGVLGIIAAIVIAVIAGVIVMKIFGTMKNTTSVSHNSTKTESVQMIDVRGMSLEKATDELSEMGLEVKSSYRSDPTVEKGQVIDQSIAADESVPAGSVVELTVSSGKDGVTIPDVSGLSYAEAKVALENEGFTVQKEESASDQVEKDHVVSQNPAAGESVESGSTVTVVISTGASTNTVTVPDIRMQTEEDAKNLLTAANLTWSSITEEYNDTVPIGLVVSQSYSPDVTVPEGTGVSFVLSSGPDPTATTGLYKCEFTVNAPPSYAGGSALVTLTQPDTGATLFATNTTSFPVSINLSNISGSPTAQISITYTVVTTAVIEGEDGNPVSVSNSEEKTDYQTVTLTPQ